MQGMPQPCHVCTVIEASASVVINETLGRQQHTIHVLGHCPQGKHNEISKVSAQLLHGSSAPSPQLEGLASRHALIDLSHDRCPGVNRRRVVPKDALPSQLVHLYTTSGPIAQDASTKGGIVMSHKPPLYSSPHGIVERAILDGTTRQLTSIDLLHQGAQALILRQPCTQGPSSQPSTWGQGPCWGWCSALNSGSLCTCHHP